MTTGKKAFAKLPADVQQTLQNIAVDMQNWVYENAEKMEKKLESMGFETAFIVSL